MKWPKFESDFISDVVCEIQKRGKPIKHKVHSLSCKKENDASNNIILERMTLDFELYKVMSSIRMSIWSDRTVFLNARQKMSNGRIFNCKIEGRVPGSSGEEVIRKIEETIDLASRDDEGALLYKSLNAIWKNVIYSGPSKVP